MAATLRSVRPRIGPGIAGARAALRPWRPDTADPEHIGPPPGVEAVDVDTLVMEAALRAPEAQALSRALERAGLAAAVRAPEPRFEGFAWYDRLPRIRGVLTLAVVDGRTCAPDAVAAPEGGFRPPRPEAVSVVLRIAHPAGRPDEMRTVATDLALAGAPGPRAGTARALVTSGSDLTPGTLAGLLRAACFRPSGDALARDRQRRRFDEDALHAARLALAPEDDARRLAIADALSRELLWLFPADRQAVVTVHGGRVTVDLGPAPPGAGERRAVPGEPEACGRVSRPYASAPLPPSLAKEMRP